jgi:hypothetical protein
MSQYINLRVRRHAQPSVVAHIYNPRYSGKGGRRIINSRSVQAKGSSKILSKNKTKQKGLGA